MEIGRPKRKYTIEPIRDPLRRDRRVEQPVAPAAPVHVRPQRALGSLPPLGVRSSRDAGEPLGARDLPGRA